MGAIYLIRHGQASFAAEDYDRLSELGERQAEVVGHTLKARGIEPDVVLGGGMLRHRQTAQGCLRTLGCELSMKEDVGWNEYDHEGMISAFEPRFANKGEFAAHLLRSGNPRRAFQELFERAVARWLGAENDDDYHETFGEFTSRVEAALTRLHEHLSRSQTALVFTSGGAISAVCRKLLGLSDERTMRLSYTLANASITKVIYGASGMHLSTLNEHAHFEAGDPKLLSYR